MALSPVQGWLNPSYTLAAYQASAQRTLNLYPEVIESGSEKVVGYLKNAPGLSSPLATLPVAPLRGLLAGGSPLYDIAGGRMFAVAGANLYEVYQGGGYTNRSALPGASSVGNDNKPVQMFVNGNQLGIVSAGQFYIDNGNGPRQATAPAITGTCSITTGNATVTGSGSNPFLLVQPGNTVMIDGHNYTVLQIPLNVFLQPDYTKIVLTTAGLTTNAAAQFAISPFNGTAVLDGPSGTLTWTQGDAANPAVAFPLYGVAGTLIRLNGAAGLITDTVVQVNGPYSLKVLGIWPSGTYNYGITPVLAAAQGAFLDSYFVITPPGSNQLQVSAPLDGTSWDAADIASKESYPDNIGALFADHEELYVMGESKSEVWQAPGADPNFPFQRVPAACMSEGIAAPASMCGFLDGVAWIGASLRGQPVAYYAQGFQPQRVSTHAIEQVWATYSTVADAIGFSYELDGHELWQLTFPSGDATWVYDRTASLQFGKPMWHERNSWDQVTMAYHRFRGVCHAYVWGKHWVGDFATVGPQAGMIYELDSDIYSDNGQPIQRQRTFPHLCAERLRQFFSKFQVDMETAQGGVPLSVTLEWSDDGGITWITRGTAATSATKTLDRVVFWQLGSAEDRVFRLTIAGAGRTTLLAAYLDSFAGIS
jgi:hypothetical protein